ncbi:MAG: hypothetical protein ACHP84_01585 [Caulobacterales bacterium]
MKLSSIVSGFALLALVAAWSAPPAFAQATGGSTAVKTAPKTTSGKKATKTKKGHKGGKKGKKGASTTTTTPPPK